MMLDHAIPAARRERHWVGARSPALRTVGIREAQTPWWLWMSAVNSLAALWTPSGIRRGIRGLRANEF